MSRRLPQRPAWQKSLGGVILAAALLLVVEMGLRLAGVGPAYAPSSVAGWRVAAGLDRASIQGPRDGHAFLVSTDAAGLRTDLSAARTPGVLRVALLGDSTVFGWGVDDGGAVSDGLEAALRAEHPSLGAVEVLNAGQPGYSSFQAAWLFQEAVAAWQPDLTVLFLPLHDGNLVLVSDAEQQQGGAGLRAAVRVGLARHSRVYQVLRQTLYAQAGDPSLVPDHATDGEPRVPRVSDAERTAAVDRLVTTAAAWGGQVGLGLLPFQGDLEGHRPVDRPSATWARAEASSRGLRLFDARACCGPDGGHLVLPDDPGHLTAEGNHAVGASLADPVAAALSADR